MKSVRPFKTTWFLLVSLVIVGFGLSLPACTPLPRAESAREPSRTQDTAGHDLELGLAAFRRGDYPEAQHYFEGVSKHAVDEDVRRKALYGLACTRLVVARTADDYKAAMNLWQLWNQLAPPEMIDEDPRMITLLLPRLYPTELNLISSAPQDVSSSGSKNSSTPLVKVVKDKECERQLRENDREVQRLKRQIKTLRLQIEALEAIHRKIQEKKKEVSSP